MKTEMRKTMHVIPFTNLLLIVVLILPVYAREYFPILSRYDAHDVSGESLITDACLTGDGGVVFSGHRSAAPGDPHDAFFLRIDEFGDIIIWQTYGANDYDHTKAITRTHDGNYVMSGYSHYPPGGPRDAMVLKVNEMGDVVWLHLYGEPERDTAFDIIEVSPGRYFVAGDKQYAGDELSSGHIVYLDEMGDFIWEHVVHEDSVEVRFYDSCMLKNSSLVAVGNKLLPGQRSNGFAVCFDTLGTVLWQREYEFPDDHLLTTAVAAHPDRGFVMAGKSREISDQLPPEDALIMYCDNEGNLKAHTIFGGDGDDDIAELVINREGDIIVTGAIYDSDTGRDVYLGRFNTHMQPVYEWTYPVNGMQRGKAIAQPNEDRIVIGGDLLSGQLFTSFLMHIKLSDDSTMTDPNNFPLHAIPPAGLHANVHPNPFNQESVVTLELVNPAEITVDLYDLLGRHVRHITSQYYQSGIHPLHISGAGLSSGTYLLNISDGRQVQTRRITLIK